MATILKAGNVASGAQITSDSTGILEIKTGTGAGTTAITVGTDQAVTFAAGTTVSSLTTSGAVSAGSLTVNSNNISAVNSLGFRNRIINGDMRIDQRNAGASVAITTSDNYITDRFTGIVSANSKLTGQQNAGSVTPPAGFSNYLGMTVASSANVTVGATDTYIIGQQVEGYNMADFAWGTASAIPVTLSFWVRSSVTGTFGGSLRNSGATRSYPFTYTISAANTWEQKSVTIAGETSGTWLATNGIGIRLLFGLGVGSTLSGTAGSWASANYVSATGATKLIETNSATFYITGVQLEAGSVATPFERRDYGRELMMCQRYYYKLKGTTAGQYFASSFNESTTQANGTIFFPVTMRTNPTALEQSGTAGDYSIGHGTTSTTCNSVPSFGAALDGNARVGFTVSSGLTAGQGSAFRVQTSSAYLAWSAEL